MTSIKPTLGFLLLTLLPLSSQASDLPGLITPPPHANYSCPDLSHGFTVGAPFNDDWFITDMYVTTPGTFFNSYDYVESGSLISFDQNTVYLGLTGMDVYQHCVYSVREHDTVYNTRAYLQHENCKISDDKKSFDCVDDDSSEE